MRLRLSEFRSFPRKRGSKFSSCIPITGSPNGGEPERYIICHYANPSLYLECVTIKNDRHGPTDKEMPLSLSVRLLIKGDIAATHYVIYICLYSLDASVCSVNKQRYSHRQM
jgi:hypothetical protein